MTGDDQRERRRHRLTRRAFVGSSVAATLAIAGCSGGSDGDGTADDAGEEPSDGDAGGDGASAPEPIDADSVPNFPRVEDPPEAVYVPSHRNAMEHQSSTEVGDYSVTPMFTYPHKFWLVTGTDREVVDPGASGVHVMLTVRDAETGTVLPVDKGATMRVLRDDSIVDQRAPWPMISQRMGFHFGDNVPLPDQGAYTVEFDLNPLEGTRTTGAFEGRFEDPETVAFEFEFTEAFQERVVGGVEYLDEDRWGARDALDPMGMGVPYSRLPGPAEYPGQDLGTPTSGDAAFVVRYLAETHLSGDGEGYLLVSPRTPYNSVPLPDMALSVAGAIQGELVQTLDSEVGHHYGIGADLSAGDELELVVDSPPQVARHRGYETAFLEMPPMEVALS
jgi:hypothetical protein